MTPELPALAPKFSRMLGITLDILRPAPVAAALARGLADLEKRYAKGPAERVLVRIPLGDATLEGWYSPGDRELEALALIDVA